MNKFSPKSRWLGRLQGNTGGGVQDVVKEGPVVMRFVSAVSTTERTWTKGTLVLRSNGKLQFSPQPNRLKSTESWIGKVFRLNKKQPEGISERVEMDLADTTNFEDITWFAPLGIHVVRLVSKEWFVDMGNASEPELVAWLLELTKVRDQILYSVTTAGLTRARRGSAPPPSEVESSARLWSRSFKLGKKDELPKRWWDYEWNPRALKDDALKTLRIQRDFSNYASLKISREKLRVTDISLHELWGHVAIQLYFDRFQAVLSFAAVRWGDAVRNLSSLRLTVPIVFNGRTQLITNDDLSVKVNGLPPPQPSKAFDIGSPKANGGFFPNANANGDAPVVEQLLPPYDTSGDKEVELYSPFCYPMVFQFNVIPAILCTTEGQRFAVNLTRTDSEESWQRELVALLGVLKKEQLTSFQGDDALVYTAKGQLQKGQNSFVSDMLHTQIYGPAVIVPFTSQQRTLVIPELCVNRPDAFHSYARLLGREKASTEVIARAQRSLFLEICHEQTSTAARLLRDYSSLLLRPQQVLYALKYHGVPASVLALRSFKNLLSGLGEDKLARWVDVHILVQLSTNKLDNLLNKERLDTVWTLLSRTTGSTFHSPGIPQLVAAWLEASGENLIAPALYDLLKSCNDLSYIPGSIESEYQGPDTGEFDQSVHYAARLIGSSKLNNPYISVYKSAPRYSPTETAILASRAMNLYQPPAPASSKSVEAQNSPADTAAYSDALDKVFIQALVEPVETLTEDEEEPSLENNEKNRRRRSIRSRTKETEFEEPPPAVPLTRQWLLIALQRAQVLGQRRTWRLYLGAVRDAVELAENAQRKLATQRKGERCLIAVMKAVTCEGSRSECCDLVLRAVFLVFQDHNNSTPVDSAFIVFQLLRWLKHLIEHDPAGRLCVKLLQEVLSDDVDSLSHEGVVQALLVQPVLPPFLDIQEQIPTPPYEFKPTFEDITTLPLNSIMERRVRNRQLSRPPSASTLSSATTSGIGGACFMRGPVAGYSEEDLAQRAARGGASGRGGIPPFGPLSKVNGRVAIVRISCGHRHSALVTRSGLALTFGYGGAGRLGHGDSLSVDVPKIVSFFVRDNVKVDKVECGRDHTIFIGRNDIAEGQVFCCGWGEAGRLGNGKDDGIVATPALVTHYERQGVVLPTSQISCVAAAAGRDHTILVMSTGDVYTCGSGANGQLGHGDTQEHLTPRYVQMNLHAEDSVVSCAAGDALSVALTRNGKVYSWGFGESGALGHGSRKTLFAPQEIRTLSVNASITAIACGNYHTAALDDKGRVWCWGDNGNGQLGVSQNFSEALNFMPQLVRISNVAQGTCTIKHISCGSYTTNAIAEDNRLFSWGVTEIVAFGSRHPAALAVPPSSSPVVDVQGGSHQMLLLTASVEVDEEEGEAVDEEEKQQEETLSWDIKEWRAVQGNLDSHVGSSRVLFCGTSGSDKMRDLGKALELQKFHEIYALVGRNKACFCAECKRTDQLGPYAMEYLQRIALGARLVAPKILRRPLMITALNGKDVREISSDGFVSTHDGTLYQWSRSCQNVDVVQPLHTANVRCSRIVANNRGVCCALVGAQPQAAKFNSHVMLFARDGRSLQHPTILWPSHEKSAFADISMSDSRVVIVDAQGAVYELDLARVDQAEAPVGTTKLRERIKLMYLKYAPEKLHAKTGFLDKLLQQYVDREEELLHLLMQNYGSEPAFEEVIDPMGFARAHPMLVQGPLLKRRIISCSCSRKLALAVSHAGHLFSWTTPGSTPKEIFVRDKAGRNERILQAACGKGHCVALTKQGKVYTWGEGRFGQLGLGDRQSRKEPEVVEMKPRIKVTKVCAGNFHTVFLEVNGKCHVFGRGAQGQLGLGDLRDRLSPCVLKLRQGTAELRVLDVACAANSTVFVTRAKSKLQQ